jgi:hypothetical protein
LRLLRILGEVAITSALLQENYPLIAEAHDIALAKQSSKELAALFPEREKDPIVAIMMVYV